MKKIILTVMLFVPILLLAESTVKVRDFCFIDGLKENQLIGYGIVAGLQGSGDSKLALTNASMKNLLKNMGISDPDIFKSKNAAAVLVTAKLPSIVRVGDRIDVTVASIGDAKSLDGGVLLQSALKGADDVIYAVAQGNLTLKENSKNKMKSVKTSGFVSQGALVEKNVETEFIQNNSFTLVLNELDFSVADELSKMVEEEYPDAKPLVSQSGRITFNFPADISQSEFISKIMEMEVTPKYKAKVVINEKDGTIVMGSDVKISESVVSKDGMTVKIDGQTEKTAAALIKESSTVKDLVDALNYVNASGADLVAIIKALKDAGALHAELVIK